MPQVKIRNTDLPGAKIRNEVPNAKISSFAIAETSRRKFGGIGYPIGLLLTLTYTAIQVSQPGNILFGARVKIRNTD